MYQTPVARERQAEKVETTPNNVKEARVLAQYVQAIGGLVDMTAAMAGHPVEQEKPHASK